MTCERWLELENADRERQNMPPLTDYEKRLAKAWRAGRNTLNETLRRGMNEVWRESLGGES